MNEQYEKFIESLYTCEGAGSHGCFCWHCRNFEIMIALGESLGRAQLNHLPVRGHW